MNKITIIGDGGWGTALAVLLAKNNTPVTLWGVFPKYIEYLRQKRVNKKFLPGIKIPDSVEITPDLNHALSDTDLVIIAVPSQYYRSVLKKISRCSVRNTAFLSVTKGIEVKTGKRMSQLLMEELKGIQFAVLSGPNIAFEVASAIPSAAVCASRNKRLAGQIQNILMTETFRVYTSNDIVGVELAGTFKNIIAIACGISDGLGFGTNTKAALLTRGLAEITRLGLAMGAKYKTFYGLSGMGDLVTTCLSQRSRNRWFGEQLGRGKKLKTILKETEMVVEGVFAVKSAIKLAGIHKIEMPITQQIYQVIYQNKKPAVAVQSLMKREKKSEA